MQTSHHQSGSVLRVNTSAAGTSNPVLPTPPPSTISLRPPHHSATAPSNGSPSSAGTPPGWSSSASQSQVRPMSSGNIAGMSVAHAAHCMAEPSIMHQRQVVLPPVSHTQHLGGPSRTPKQALSLGQEPGFIMQRTPTYIANEASLRVPKFSSHYPQDTQRPSGSHASPGRLMKPLLPHQLVAVASSGGPMTTQVGTDPGQPSFTQAIHVPERSNATGVQQTHADLQASPQSQDAGSAQLYATPPLPWTGSTQPQQSVGLQPHQMSVVTAPSAGNSAMVGLPCPPRSAPSRSQSRPTPPTTADTAHPPAGRESQDQTQPSDPYSILKWEPGSHARHTFNLLGRHFTELVHAAETQLSRELTYVKAHVVRLEKNLVAVVGERDAARTQRDAALAGAEKLRAEQQRERAALQKAFHAAIQLDRQCKVVRAEGEQVNREREALQEENWQLKEVVAKLSVNMHRSEKERIEGSAAGEEKDTLLTNALVQARKECERRIQIEKELTELRALVSKQALLQTAAASPTSSWSDALHSSLASCFGEQLNEQVPEASASHEQTSPAPHGEGYTGLPTPLSKTGTIERESVPPSAVMNTTVVIDLTLSDGESSPVLGRDGVRKRSRSPSLLDGAGALKRRRQMPRASTEEQASRLVDIPSPVPSVCPHKSGSAAMSMVLSPVVDTAALPEPEPGPDETLTSGVQSSADSQDLTLSDLDLQYEEEDELQEAGETRIRETPTLERAQKTVTEQSQQQQLFQMPQIPQREQQHLQEEVEVDQLKEEDGEIKEEVQLSPQIAPAAASASASAPAPESCLQFPPPVRALSMKQDSLFSTPPPSSPGAGLSTLQPSSSPMQRPPVRKQFSVSHIPVVYDKVGSQYYCVMCRSRQKRDRSFRVASFPLDSTWPVLASHIQGDHPAGLAKILSMSSEEIAELMLRKR